MSILVKWNATTSGPLTRGWIPDGLSHTDFEGSFNNEIEAGWLVGKYKGTLESLPDYGLEEYTIPEEVVEEPTSVKITRLAFLNRFPDDVAITIDLASLPYPDDIQEVAVQKATIRRYMKKVDSATYIDVKLQETRDGVNNLVGTLLTQEVADAILSPIINEGEAYQP